MIRTIVQCNACLKQIDHEEIMPKPWIHLQANSVSFDYCGPTCMIIDIETVAITIEKYRPTFTEQVASLNHRLKTKGLRL